MRRRSFLSQAGVSLAAAALPGHMSGARNAQAASVEKETRSFMNQYYYGILDIANGIRDTELDKIAAAMEKAYELKRNGGNLASHVNYGHYSMFAGSRDRPGQPWVLPQCGITPTKEEFDAMKAGDFLITDRIDAGTLTLRDRGVYVVGVTNNYYRFAETPEGGLVPNRMEHRIEEVSDLVIDSYMPWNNGLVSAPEIPHFKLCPSTGIAQFLVYWSCTAALAALIGSKGKDCPRAAAKRYLDIALERFRMIGADRPKIDRVAEIWADLVLGKGARLLVYGHDQDVKSYGPTVTKNMYVNDACICASSSMIAQTYTQFADDVRDTDIVLIGAFTSDNADELRAAREARKAGAFTTAFCPYATDGDSSGARLFKEVDVAFNTYSGESAGVIEAKGFEEKVSPVAGIAGNLVHWMLTAQWTGCMADRGEMPYYWQGYHETGGKEYDEAVLPYFKRRGY